MAASAWENSSSLTGSDDAASAPQTASSVWNMTGLVNGLPAVASAPGGLGGSELTGLKQNRMVVLTGDSASPDVTAGGWGSVSVSIGKESGWDRPDSDVNLDIGTMAWESQQPSVTSGVWGQPQNKPSAQWGDIDIRQKNGLIIRDTGELPWDIRPKSWGDISADLASSQNGNTSVPSSSAASSQPSVGTSSSTSTTAESTTTTSLTETSETDNSSASSMPQVLSRDEVIAKAINSNEPWGRTPIRQDVPWVIDEEPTVREPIPSVPKLPTVDPADAQISRIGTGAWEQLRGGAAGAATGWMGTGRSREDSGSWSISSPDGLNVAGAGPPGVGREFAGGVVGMSAFRPPVERPSSSTGGLLSAFPADRPSTAWGGNLESGENLWKDDRKDTRGNFGGVAQQPLRRNLSTGNWPGDEQGWNSAGGASAEVEDLINQGRQQNWRSVNRPPTAQSVGQAGFRPRPDERGDASMFGVPPPSLQPGFRPGSRAGSQEDVGAAGQWGSLSVKLPNAAAAGGWGDPAAQWPPAGIDATRLKAPPSAAPNWSDDWNSRKQPQTRTRMLQQLMDVGFRKEEAQAALINNNMDLRSAIAELMASHNSLDPAARSSTTPVDIRFAPGAAARQQQVLVDQLQQQQQQQRLLSSLGGILSSGLPINANQLQKLMQQQAPDAHGRVAVSPESVQAALQQQQMALLQSAHAAVQANLIPPHLIAAVPSLNPTVASKLQRLVQLVDVHQKLGNQAQLPVPGYPASADFNAVIKQQILQLRQEVVLALTSSIPPPPLANQAPAALPADMLRGSNVQSPEDLAASSRLSQWKQPADGSSKPLAGVPSNGPLSTSAAWPTVYSVNSTASDKNADGSSQQLPEGSLPSNLEIEEFVPGKPWQGPSMRSVEDDPYITPGSVTRSGISAVDDAHVMNVLGPKMLSSAAGIRASGRQGSSVWSHETDVRSTTHPTGPQLGRSISWAPGDRTNAPMNSAVSAPTSSIRIRNLPPQIDHVLLKALLERFGSLRYFVPSPSGDQIFVSFVRAEDAMQAHRTLTAGAPGGLPPLVMEFISDVDLMRSLDQTGVMPAVARLPDYTGNQSADSGWASGAFGGGSGGSVWSSGGGVEDHSSFLPSDLFSGGQ